MQLLLFKSTVNVFLFSLLVHKQWWKANSNMQGVWHQDKWCRIHNVKLPQTPQNTPRLVSHLLMWKRC